MSEVPETSALEDAEGSWLALPGCKKPSLLAVCWYEREALLALAGHLVPTHGFCWSLSVEPLVQDGPPVHLSAGTS